MLLTEARIVDNMVNENEKEKGRERRKGRREGE